MSTDLNQFYVMKKVIYILPVLLLIAFTACKQPASNKDKEEVKESEEIESVELDNTENDIEELDDQIREFGLIETIEDGAYPFFMVTVNFIEREMMVKR